MKVGIDFGTTNSSVAWFNPQTQRVENILFDNRDARVPSLVYWDNDPSRRSFGYEAAIANKDAEEGGNVSQRMAFRRHLAMSFKTDFAKNIHNVATLNLGEIVSPDVVVKAYFSWLINEIRARTNTPGREQISATLTYPTTAEWGMTGESGPACRLKAIAEEVGFANVDMMREPEAAFREAKRRNIELGQGILVFDLGGGTLDLVYYKRNANDEFDRPFVSGQGRSGIAGDAFDNVVCGLLDMQIRRASNNVLGIGHVVAAKRRARYAKERLSSQDEVSVALAIVKESEGTVKDSALPTKVTITRDAFERSANNTFEQIKNELIRYVERIRNQNAPLDTVLLIGGSTNIPKIQRIVEDVTNAKCIRPSDADFYVSLGSVDVKCAAKVEESDNRKPTPVPTIRDSEKYFDGLCECVSKTFSKLTYSKWRGRLYAIGVSCDPSETLLTIPGVPSWKLYASASFDAKKLYNAKASMGVVSKEKEMGIMEFCLVQGDSTILGGGREGFLCTARGIYMKLDDGVASFAEWGKDLTFHVRDNGFFVKKSGDILGSADMFWPPFQLHELVTGLSNLCAWITANRPMQQ